MAQSEMFPKVTQSIVCAASCEVDGSWHLRVAVRVEGDHWGPTPWAHYDALSASEMLDVLFEEVAKALGTA